MKKISNKFKILYLDGNRKRTNIGFLQWVINWKWRCDKVKLVFTYKSDEILQMLVHHSGRDSFHISKSVSFL